MRGQAFLTFPSVEVAHRALVIILNTFLLHVNVFVSLNTVYMMYIPLTAFCA